MHDNHHMSFRWIGSKNQLGEFPVAIRGGPGSRGSAIAQGTALSGFVNHQQMRASVECRPVYTLTGRQNQAFTAEVDDAGWFAWPRLVSRF